MKVFTIILSIILALVLIVLIFAGWLGFFSNLTITEKTDVDYVVAGQEHIGDYSKVGILSKNIDSKLRTSGINCTRGFGIYYDNPNITPKEKCRSFLGNIIEEKDYSRLVDIKKLGLKVDTIHKKQTLVIEFPYKNMISFVVGPMKAYPFLNKYIKEKGYKPTLVWELYDVPNKKIYFKMQL